MPKAGSEVAAIEEAYADQIKHLFTLLIKNLEVEPGKEKEIVDRFKAGLNISKRAKQLALNVVPHITTSKHHTQRLGRQRAGSLR